MSFIFNGILFISNAAFNNLGYPTTSTIMNIGKATIGTIPLVYFGGLWFGAIGVIAGQALGSVIFGVIAWVWAQRILKRLGEENQAPITLEEKSLNSALPLTPFCSSRAYMCADSEECMLETKDSKK